MDGEFKSADETRLKELGAALNSCLDIFTTMWDLEIYKPSSTKPSSGWVDANAILTKPDGSPWPTDLYRYPGSIAVKLLSQQTDFCVALGLLTTNGVTGEPHSTLVRTLVEYAAQTLWVLSPNVNHRERCARSILFEMVSSHQNRRTLKVSLTGQEYKARRSSAKSDYEALERKVKDCFTYVELDKDPTKSCIEGQHYTSWSRNINELLKQSAETNPTDLYSLLSVLAHPQGFSATYNWNSIGCGKVDRTVSITDTERLCNYALVAFYSSLTLVANYNARRPDELIEWEDYLERVMPGIFGSQANPEAQ